jgi:predicted DNA-binding antitoxin AbrB/MazE fold protein
MTINAIFENGVFRPIDKVDIPDHCRVQIEVRQVQEEPKTQAPMSPGLEKIYEILGRRYNSGHTDTAERHNDHQP